MQQFDLPSAFPTPFGEPRLDPEMQARLTDLFRRPPPGRPPPGGPPGRPTAGVVVPVGPAGETEPPPRAPSPPPPDMPPPVAAGAPPDVRLMLGRAGYELRASVRRRRVHRARLRRVCEAALFWDQHLDDLRTLRRRAFRCFAAAGRGYGTPHVRLLVDLRGAVKAADERQLRSARLSREVGEAGERDARDELALSAQLNATVHRAGAATDAVRRLLVE